jgi:dTDP-4-amino-4,6-dideoxygalactose transaminase
MYIVEDAAQSIGGRSRSTMNGGFGDIATTSFFPSKPLGCYGDGGAIFTRNKELADVIRSLRIHGKGASKYDNVRVGINSRLDSIQAAVLLAKLEVLDEEIGRRQEISDQYRDRLGDRFEFQAIPDGDQSGHAQFSIVLKAGANNPHKRDTVIKALQEDGIPSVVYYPIPLHENSAYKDTLTTKYTPCPTSTYLSQNILSLPMHPYLSDHDQNSVCESLQRAIGKI